MSEFEEYFDDVQIAPLLIPDDCQDGFLAAYWKRPEAYLNPKVRQAISTFSTIEDCSAGLENLRQDIRSGAWEEKNKSILICFYARCGIQHCNRKNKNCLKKAIDIAVSRRQIVIERSTCF